MRNTLSLLFLCSFLFALARAQYDGDEDVFDFSGESEDIEVEVTVATPKVSAGDTVKGMCVVLEKANQNDYEFAIVRENLDGSEDILDTQPSFAFTVQSAEELEDLKCRAHLKGNTDLSDEKPFTVEFQGGHSLMVERKSRGQGQDMLVCQLQPRPASLSRFKFRWIDARGQMIANGPLAMLTPAQMKEDGFVCECMDTMTQKTFSRGLRSSVLSSAQARYIEYRATVHRTPQKLSANTRYSIKVVVSPRPPSQMTYTWTFNGQPRPMFTGDTYIIPSLKSQDAGTYEVRVGFVDENGNRQTLTAREKLTRRGGGGSRAAIILLDLVPKTQTKQNGDTTTFHCNVKNGDPRRITWKFQHTSVAGLPDARHATPLPAGWIEDYSDSSSFITKLSVDQQTDEGIFFCILEREVETGHLIIQKASETEIWGSEEEGSEVSYCSAGESRCNDGTCYPINKRCDGFNDCSSGEDERGCSCDPAIRACKANQNGQPKKQNYNVNWECDGEDDCGNGYDESDCRQINTCYPDRMFTCPNSQGRKIPSAYLCDGADDCPNGEDEQRCQQNQLSFQRTQQVDFTATEGERIMVNCTVTAYPPPRVVWRFNWRCLPGQEDGGSQVPFSGSVPPATYRVTSRVTGCESGMPTTTSTMFIDSTQAMHGGIYNCEALVGSQRAMSQDMIVRVNGRSRV